MPATKIHTLHNPDPEKHTYGETHMRRYLEKFFPDEVPDSPVISVEEITVAPGMTFKVYAWGFHIFVNNINEGGIQVEWNHWGQNTRMEPATGLVQAERISDAYAKQIKVKVSEGSYWTRRQEIKQVTDGYFPPEHKHYRSASYYGQDVSLQTPYAYIKYRVTPVGGGCEPVEVELKFEMPTEGQATLDETGPGYLVTSEFFGMTRTWRESLTDNESYNRNGLKRLVALLRHGSLSEPPDVWWKRWLDHTPQEVTKDTGLAGVLKKKGIKPVLARLQFEAPLDYTFFRWLRASKSTDKTTNNVLLAEFLKTVGAEYDKLLGALHTARTVTLVLDDINLDYNCHRLPAWHNAKRAICLTLPGAKQKYEDAQAKADFTKRKSFGGQADGLGVGKATYPLLRRAIEGGHIPIGVFNQPDKQPVNREFDLWEKALKQPGWAEVIYEIASNAARRGTYERDITPYLMFLFRLPVYLKRHTKKKWTTKPKFVQSQWELEMEEADESGTTKRRSAFTPVADNDMREVEVPYVAVSVSGVRTQWCYSRHFYIFEEGFTDPESGGMVIRDLEPKLNGRDDYGLCYYTLTGTETARGYPTFLIIFEKVQSGPDRVHFHRVRPQRIKNKIKTPACELIKACYQYMAGNVPAEQVAFQQGDLLFIPHPNDPVVKGAKVGDPQEATTLEFESHKFEVLNQAARITLYRSEAKTPANRLGFLCATGGFKLSHPEHDDINEIGEGWWEVRRARSFEASPTGIWSLTID